MIMILFYQLFQVSQAAQKDPVDQMDLMVLMAQLMLSNLKIHPLVLETSQKMEMMETLIPASLLMTLTRHSGPWTSEKNGILLQCISWPAPKNVS